MTIWWEILYFSIKKYIRNSGKCNYLPGENTFFPDLYVIVYIILIELQLTTREINRHDLDW